MGCALTMGHEHYLTRCLNCGTIVNQCACSDFNKPETFTTCTACVAAKTTAGEELRYDHVVRLIARQITPTMAELRVEFVWGGRSENVFFAKMSAMPTKEELVKIGDSLRKSFMSQVSSLSRAMTMDPAVLDLCQRMSPFSR